MTEATDCHCPVCVRVAAEGLEQPPMLDVTREALAHIDGLSDEALSKSVEARERQFAEIREARAHRDAERDAMRRPSSEYRELIADIVNTGDTWRLCHFLPFRAAKDVAEMKRIAEGIMAMSDEELDRLRDSLTPAQEPDSQAKGDE